ncbi:recombinase family protein [Thalassorhabdus alkalitolerans]|uniref:Recombinase family protein n=1 Tax=Thalassorhabdus alkalitolerans TaxID=2282697 RepID=A0ABW0YK35_9BACI
MDEGKLIIYGRVSTEEQKEKGYSLESQIERCLLKAKSMGYKENTIHVIRDQASGATLERQGLKLMRQYVKQQTIDIIIIYDPDRLSRNLTHQLLLTDEFVKQGVRLEFVNFEWKNTPEGMMYYQLRGIFAQYEREKIRERTIRGRIEKIKKHGKLSFDPRLFGYTFNTETDQLMINKKEGAVVKLIFQWASEGQSGEKIAEKLARRGIPAPRGETWYGSTVTRILKNQSYLGTYYAYKSDYHQGFKRERPLSEQFPLPIEALVDQRTFEKVQKVIASHRSHAGRPAVYPYLIEGTGVCYCGRSMGTTVKSGRRSYTYYACTGKHKKSYCSHRRESQTACKSPYWNSAIVDQVLWDTIVEYIKQPPKGNERYNNEKNSHARTQEAYVLKKEKEELLEKKQRILDLYLDGKVDKVLLEKKMTEINDKLVLVSANEKESSENKVEKQDIEKKTGKAAWEDEYRHKLNNLSYTQKKRITKLLVRRIIFKPDRELVVDLNISGGNENIIV